MFVFDVRILSCDFIKDFMKQTVGQFHDVVFREAGYLFAIVRPGVLESVAHDFFRARTRNQFQTLHDLIGLAMLDTGVKIFFVFTNDHDVHARVLRFDKWMIGHAGTNIRVKAERLTDRNVKTFVTTALRRSDRGFQKNFCVAERIPRARIDAGGVPGQIDLFTDVYPFDVQSGATFFQNVKGGIHDFRTNAVAVGDGDRYCWHR